MRRSPAQVLFQSDWDTVVGREIELEPVEGGFVHGKSRTLILLGNSSLELQAPAYGWRTWHVNRLSIEQHGATGLTRAIAADIRHRIAQERAA